MVKRKNQLYANSVRYILLLILVTSVLQVAYGHKEEIHEATTESFFHQYNPKTVIFLSSIAILSTSIMTIANKDRLNENQKKIFFGIIAVVAILSTGYLVSSSIYMSLTSWSKGLIHWHADFEIWICGEKVKLGDPKGLASRVGTEEVHHHGDYRIHLEGVINEREEATLGHFFDAIGVDFSNERIMNMENGNYCPDGKRGDAKMFVNGELYTGNYRDYIIAPYSNVPPGDLIKIVFE